MSVSHSLAMQDVTYLAPGRQPLKAMPGRCEDENEKLPIPLRRKTYLFPRSVSELGLNILHLVLRLRGVLLGGWITCGSLATGAGQSLLELLALSAGSGDSLPRPSPASNVSSSVLKSFEPAYLSSTESSSSRR